jgi:adenylate kinase
MRLLMMGPPGSGKGTHGSRLADDFAVRHLSSGEALRAEMANDTPLGRTIGGHVTRGDLVPDDVLFGLMIPIAVRAMREGGGFVADGFPRTLAQAERAYREIGIDRDLKFEAVVSLDVPEEVLIGRMLERARVQGRADDTPEVIRHRLEVYRDETGRSSTSTAGETSWSPSAATSRPTRCTRRSRPPCCGGRPQRRPDNRRGPSSRRCEGPGSDAVRYHGDGGCPEVDAGRHRDRGRT